MGAASALDDFLIETFSGDFRIEGPVQVDRKLGEHASFAVGALLAAALVFLASRVWRDSADWVEPLGTGLALCAGWFAFAKAQTLWTLVRVRDPGKAAHLLAPADGAAIAASIAPLRAVHASLTSAELRILQKVLDRVGIGRVPTAWPLFIARFAGSVEGGPSSHVFFKANSGEPTFVVPDHDCFHLQDAAACLRIAKATAIVKHEAERADAHWQSLSAQVEQQIDAFDDQLAQLIQQCAVLAAREARPTASAEHLLAAASNVARLTVGRFVGDLGNAAAAIDAELSALREAGRADAELLARASRSSRRRLTDAANETATAAGNLDDSHRALAQYGRSVADFHRSIERLLPSIESMRRALDGLRGDEAALGRQREAPMEAALKSLDLMEGKDVVKACRAAYVGALRRLDVGSHLPLGESASRTALVARARSALSAAGALLAECEAAIPASQRESFARWAAQPTV